MTDEKEWHVNEDDLLRAIVDKRDLPESLRDHLSACPLCFAEKERAQQNLVRLGQMAEHFSPFPRRRVRLSASLERPSRWWTWRGALAAMATAALVLVVYGSIEWRTRPEERLAAITQEMQEDERLMTEVSLLSENALPGLWLDISGESDPGLDEEFIEFVVPSAEGDVVSLKEEGVLC